jgi:hypothetical protein
VVLGLWAEGAAKVKRVLKFTEQDFTNALFDPALPKP